MDYSIWVTSTCNMKCKYCYVEEMKDKQNFPIASVYRLMDFICNTYNNQRIKINFFGGEPLLNLKLIKLIVSEIEKHEEFEVSYYMTTNGLLLDDETISYLKKKDFRLSLSWDGTKRANDLNRIDQNGNGTYERIEKAYRLLIDNDLPDVRVRGTFNSDTIEFLMESIENFCSIDPNIDVIMIPDYYDLGWTEEKLQKLSKIVKLVRCNTKFSHSTSKCFSVNTAKGNIWW